MECPNCGYFLNNENFANCPNCKINIYLYLKTKNMSVVLYNKALEKAKINDLSESETLLEKSILFNKFNIDARNLLGLVYFEKGKIGNALKQWIVSTSLKKDNNKAKYYIEQLHKNTRVIDKMNDAISMYNKSITYIKQDSIDIAIIQLKKSINLNPKLVEAYNLLCICFIYNKKYDIALKYVEKVLKIDINNKYARKYLSILKGNVKLKSPIIKRNICNINENLGEFQELNIRKKRKSNIPYIQHNKKFSIIGSGEIISFFIGVICASSLLLTLLLPSMIDTRDNEISNLKEKILMLENKNSSLERIEKIEETEVNIEENLKKLNEALYLGENQDFENCAKLLDEIKSDNFDDIAKEQLQNLINNVYPIASRIFFDKGKIEFINNNYEKAEEYLDFCLKISNNEDFVDDTLYYLGKIAESNMDYQLAKKNFEEIVNNFKDSNQYKNAENCLKNIIDIKN